MEIRVPFRSVAEIEQSLIGAGVSAGRARELAALSKPCVWLETFKVEDETAIPLGATKLGGRPDLPAGMPWPERPGYPDARARTRSLDMFEALVAYEKEEQPDAWNEEDYLRGRREAEAEDRRMFELLSNPYPLTFIGQFNLGEIGTSGELDSDIPGTGLLQLFYDADQQPGGAIGLHLQYLPEPLPKLQRREPPKVLQHLEWGGAFPALGCRPRHSIAPVPFESVELPKLDPDDPDRTTFVKWFIEGCTFADGTASTWLDHRVGGHPSPIQNDAQTECALTEFRRSYAESGPITDDIFDRAVREARDWVLLLQIGTDYDSGMMWGDSGRLYVFARRDDLRRRDFHKARVIMQCC